MSDKIEEPGQNMDHIHVGGCRHVSQAFMHEREKRENIHGSTLKYSLMFKPSEMKLKFSKLLHSFYCVCLGIE